MKKKVTQLFQHLKKSTERRWFLPVTIMFSFLDAYIPIVPNEVFLSLGVIPRVKRWVEIALLFSIASAAGATSLAALVSSVGQRAIDQLFPAIMQDPTWLETVAWMKAHGALGLGLVALSPFPQHAAVIILALAQAPLSIIFFAVLIGRFLKYATVAWFAGKSPNTLRKFGLLSPS